MANKYNIELINELVESWICGNKSHVAGEYFNMSLKQQTIFLQALFDAEQWENFNRYLRAKEG